MQRDFNEDLAVGLGLVLLIVVIVLLLSLGETPIGHDPIGLEW